MTEPTGQAPDHCPGCGRYLAAVTICEPCDPEVDR